MTVAGAARDPEQGWPPASPEAAHNDAPDTLGGIELGWDCQTCGACCSYSAEWPRFTLETDEALDLIPARYVAADERGMRCEDSRCSALSGRVGVNTSCQVYDVRPDVCRACLPGDHACLTARAAFGLDRDGDGGGEEPNTG